MAAAGVHLGEVGVLVKLEQPRPPGRVRPCPAPAAKLFLALTLFRNYTVLLITRKIVTIKAENRNK